MIHNQLKAQYPTGPFLWEYNDMRNIFNARVEIIDRDILFQEVIDQIAIQNERDDTIRDHNLDRENIYFLFELTNATTINLNKKNIFIRSKQKIQRLKKKLWINFHTTVYAIDNDIFFDEDFETDIAWCIIPIIGDVHSIDDNNYTIKSKEYIKSEDNTNNSTIKKVFDPKTYTINNLYTRRECCAQTTRISNRKFVKRDIIYSDSKTDQYINEHIALPKCELVPRGEQIILTNKVRKNAYLIRDNLMHRSNRLKISENPELLKQRNSIDLCLRNISDNIALQNNMKYKSDEITIDNDRFDYKLENIIIKKTCGIWRFCPMSTGRININSDDNTIRFLTILKYKNYFIITLHIIDRY